MLENIRKLISGERGVGKSFYVKKMIKDNNLSCEGILTKRVANGVTLSYMRDFKILKKKYCAKIIDAKMVADISVFENFGVEILDILQNSNKLIVIDEIGFLELNAKEYCRKLVNLLEVEDILKVQVRKLSLGQRMKCELIAALLYSPKVIFLDEPTIGLDVVMQKKIRDFIKEYNQRYKATIILTSHYMGDVKELCRRVIIIDKGKLIFDNQLSEITQKYSNHKLISVILTRKIDPKFLGSIAKIKEFNYPKLVYSVRRNEIPQITAKILEKLPVTDLNIEEPAIEDIIRGLFTGKNYV